MNRRKLLRYGASIAAVTVAGVSTAIGAGTPRLSSAMCDALMRTAAEDAISRGLNEFNTKKLFFVDGRSAYEYVHNVEILLEQGCLKEISWKSPDGSRWSVYLKRYLTEDEWNPAFMIRSRQTQFDRTMSPRVVQFRSDWCLSPQQNQELLQKLS